VRGCGANTLTGEQIKMVTTKFDVDWDA